MSGRKSTGNDKKKLNDKIDLNFSKIQLKQLINEAIDKATAPLYEEIKQLKSEIIEVKKSQEYIGRQYEKLQNECTAIQKKSSQQNQELKEVKNSASNIIKSNSTDRAKLDELEQYTRRQNLVLEGVPYNEGENVNKVVTQLVEKLDFDLKNDDISIAHRLPMKENGKTKTNNNHPAIIVRFVNRSVRNAIYAKRAAAAKITNFPVKNMEKLYINENLTQPRKRLFWLTKQAVKRLHYKFIWTNNGDIFVRKDENSEKIHVSNENDIRHL